jgi:hypothetical protein
MQALIRHASSPPARGVPVSSPRDKMSRSVDMGKMKDPIKLEGEPARSVCVWVWGLRPWLRSELHKRNAGVAILIEIVIA